MCFGKTLVRGGVIAGLVGGAALVVAGPDRVMAIFHQTRDKVHQAIDTAIEDPVALRSQIRALEAQYPQRIGEVRGDLAELVQQKGQLERDLDVSRRVVALADRDLNQLQPLLAKADAALTHNVSMTGSAPVVRIVFNNEQLDAKSAQDKAIRIQQVRTAYAQRGGDIERDLGYVSQQEQRLGDLLGQLENEHASFQAQIWTLDRQIDAISRNDRMIEVMNERQETIDRHSRYRAASLDQLQGRLAEIRSEQEAKLEMLGRSTSGLNYEDRAKIEIDASRNTTGDAFAIPQFQAPEVIEITPDSPTTGVSLKPVVLR